MSTIEDECLNLKLNDELLLTNPLESGEDNLYTHQEKVICYCRDAENEREKKMRSIFTLVKLQ